MANHRRTPSPLSDIRSFEFGSTLTPEDLSIGGGYNSPFLSLSSNNNNNQHQSSLPQLPTTLSSSSSTLQNINTTHNNFGGTSNNNSNHNPPRTSSYGDQHPSPSSYLPDLAHHRSTPPADQRRAASPAPPSAYTPSAGSGIPTSTSNRSLHQAMRGPSYDQYGGAHSSAPYDAPPHSPYHQQQPPQAYPQQPQSAYEAYHGGPLGRHDSRGEPAGGRRALPMPPPAGGNPPQSPTTAGRRRALPVPPGAAQAGVGPSPPPPSVPPRPQQSYNTDYVSRPAPTYEPPAPGPIMPPPKPQTPPVHSSVQRSTTSATASTQLTHGTGESFFAGGSESVTVTPNTSVSSRFSGGGKREPMENLDYRRPPPVDEFPTPHQEQTYQETQTYQEPSYRTYQQDDYRQQLPRLEEPPYTPPERPYAASNGGDRTPSASNGYLPHLDVAHSSDRDQLDVYQDRSRTVSATSFDQFPSTPKGVPMRTLDHQRSFMGESSTGTTAGSSTYVPESEPPLRLTMDTPNHGGDGDMVATPTEMNPQAGSSSQAAAAAAAGEANTEWAEQSSSRWVQTKLLLHQSQTGGYYDDDVYDEYDDSASEGQEVEEEVNEIRFFNPAFLSETAVQLRDRVVRGHHVKGGITWVGTFTGRDLVTTIQSLLPTFTREGPQDRRFALITARSLQSQLWMVEVDWDTKPIRDSSDVVFKFMDEMEGFGGGSDPLTIALPSGVLTMATKCYSPSCTGDSRCYAPRCPWKTSPSAFLVNVEEESVSSRAPMVKNETDWTEDVDPVILAELSDQQRTRQTLIRQAILEEERYEADLAALESVFITPLLTAHPAIIEPYHRLEHLVHQLFGNVLEIRRASRRLIDNFAIRLREQSPLILTVGDIILEAATDFRSLYPEYMDNLTHADQLLTTTCEENRQFGAWLERVSHGGDHRWDLRYLLKRPATYLQKYPTALEQILKSTSGDDPDYDFLNEALSSIQNISYIAQLKLWHASKGRGPNANLKWYDIVPATVRESMEKKEFKRQMHIWELIQGEMEYVADLEAIETVFVTPLREAEQPIIDRSRLDIFIDDAFHNYRSLYEVHSRLLEGFQERQIEQHPKFGMISDLILNAALNWHEAYMEYMPHYPIAKAKIDEEKMRNPAFARFLAECLKNPLSNRQEINHYIYRPIARLLRYPLLLKDILAAQEAVGPPDHPDIDTIPQIIDLIDNLAKAGQKGVAVNQSKVELWHMKTTLDGGKFGPRAVKDLDLLNPMRELIHKGKVYRQPEGTISGAWSELYLLLFDNYFVLVKQSKSKNRDAPPRYTINRRPIPLELFKLGEFSDPAQNRSLGLLKTFRGGGPQTHEDDSQRAAQSSDSRTVYPFTYSFIGQGQLSGQYTLWTDSASARQEWQEKLNHAKVLRNEVNDAGKVFEMTPLSVDTFFQAPGYGVPANNDDYTGRVTCSVPFTTVDRRSLVAVGCEQGVWIGVRHDPSSLRKVLHVRSVTQIAVLEEFGIFLVLADKSLLAYHLEALVPTAASPQVRSAPQRLSGVRDIVFFCVGQISGRTLVLYMKRKQIDSVFRVLEPILNRETPDNRQRRGFGSLLGQRSEWFRVYKDFFIPTEALHVHFLKAKLAIVCSKGFEIMDLTDLKGGAIPIFDPLKVREKPMLAELQRQCENAKPLAMFRSTDSEFLLCYDAFGIYVDRHGEPNRDYQVIEWEGRPEKVAFHPPYLLLISPSFIEIRHIDSAKLLQIYTGSDIRLTWDGTGGMAHPFNDAPGPKGWGDEVKSQEPRIHICKRTDDARRTRGIGEHIFELTPTLLLNNPLLNPVYTQDPNYFPPAPLNHRASLSASSIHDYGGYAYGGGANHPIPPDRASVSSASTNNYNGMGSPGFNQFGQVNPQQYQNIMGWQQQQLESYNETLSSPAAQQQQPQVLRQTSQSNRAPPYGGAPGQGGYNQYSGGGYPGNYI